MDLSAAGGRRTRRPQNFLTVCGAYAVVRARALDARDKLIGFTPRGVSHRFGERGIGERGIAHVRGQSS